ncbi:MAG: oligosaccharide flippase family protein, partial [Synergistaceae bacterium]|nr:oligosaccharide flippase family protein [Synergistaceae bacterium]
MISQRSVFINFLWRFLERIGAQGVKVLVELILARLLAPTAYGLIALVTVFITILNVF